MYMSAWEPIPGGVVLWLAFERVLASSALTRQQLCLLKRMLDVRRLPRLEGLCVSLDDTRLMTAIAASIAAKLGCRCSGQ